MESTRDWERERKREARERNSQRRLLAGLWRWHDQILARIYQADIRYTPDEIWFGLFLSGGVI